MYIHNIMLKNFRLLANVDLALEEKTTVIVGRNNSGKTSLSEATRRFLTESSPTFQLEDFSSSSYDCFCKAHAAKVKGEEDNVVRGLIPQIELRLYFHYDPNQPQLGPLSDFVIDLDPDCHEALVVISYELQDGAIDTLFEGHFEEAISTETRP